MPTPPSSGDPSPPPALGLRRLAVSAAVAAALIFVALHGRVTRWATALIDLGTGRLETALTGSIAADLATASLLFLGLALATVSYARLLRSSALQTLRLRQLLLATTLLSVPLLLASNLLSSDLFGYLAFARTWTVHGGNPLVESPSVYPTDAYFDLVWWKQMSSPYGPTWLLVSGGLSSAVELVAPVPLAHALAFKLLALTAHLASGALVWRIAERWAPTRTRWITAAYLLNPLCLIEFAGSGHNDALVILLALFGVYCAQRSRRELAAGFLAAAAATKIYALPLLGLYLVAVARGPAPQRPSRWDFAGAATVALVSALVLIMLYAPFWAGLESFAFLRDVSQYEVNNSFPQYVGRFLVRSGLADGASLQTADRAALIQTLRLVGLGVLVLGSVRAVIKTVDLRSAVKEAGVVGLLMCFAVIWYWPWYATMAMTLAVLAADGRTARFALTLGIASLSIYVAWALFWALGGRDAALARGILAHRAGVTFLFPVGYLVYSRLSSRRMV